MSRHRNRPFVMATASAAIAIAALAIGAGRAVTQAQDAADVSLDPVVMLEGGTPARRRTVIAAIDRFVTVGLPLPDLVVRLHDGNPGCGGLQGRFRADGTAGVVDICYPGEFLALHELGHAWEHFNLDEHDRAGFRRLTGSPAWRSTDVVWRRRGAELAANALAHGLLSAPLESARSRQHELSLFSALTGLTSPRLSEIGVATTTTTVSPQQLDRLTAYTQWRAGSSPAEQVSGTPTASRPVDRSPASGSGGTGGRRS